MLDALRRLERYILKPWPYPALALSETWDVFAANERGRALFGLPANFDDVLPNLFDVMLAPAFRASILNWPQVSEVVQSRLRRHAIDFPEFRERFEMARSAGAFVDAGQPVGEDESPVILPLVFALPNGNSFRMTSMTARLTSAQDDFVSGLEIELCVPLDDASKRVLRGQ